MVQALGVSRLKVMLTGLLSFDYFSARGFAGRYFTRWCDKSHMAWAPPLPFCRYSSAWFLTCLWAKSYLYSILHQEKWPEHGNFQVFSSSLAVCFGRLKRTVTYRPCCFSSERRCCASSQMYRHVRNSCRTTSFSSALEQGFALRPRKEPDDYQLSKGNFFMRAQQSSFFTIDSSSRPIASISTL